VKTFVVYFYRHIREKNGPRLGAAAAAAIRVVSPRRAPCAAQTRAGR
jgi:hypothetical protein